VIHTREAEEDTFGFSIERARGDIGGVFHCFTGDRAMAPAALDLGFHIRLPASSPFPRERLRKEADGAAERLLVETDSPFLAPVPHRGKRTNRQSCAWRRRSPRCAASTLRRLARRCAPTSRAVSAGI
jgi:TatD DNase family protein